MDREAFERIYSLDEEQKIKVLGGKTKAALFDAGLLDLKNYLKPLKDIDLSGIMIPDASAMNHSVVGDYILPSIEFKNGRLGGGGHTVQAMAEMDRRGITYNIVRTGNNGVIFGNVPNHDDKFKRANEGQVWFPKSWTAHDIMSAGIYTANKGDFVSSYAKEAIYKNVNVRVLLDKGRIASINPSYDQPS
ncbi:MAG: EndoU domain-containing protein [Oscillospiraceae bacterium]|nr:EndoU domain-containing protein [Oscillospiraceae bacterium]